MSAKVRLAGFLRRFTPFLPAAAVQRPLAERIDFADPAVARDPYPSWRALRTEGPVHFLPNLGGWLVLGFAEVREAFSRPDLFSNEPYGEVDTVLLGQDPPLHAGTRRLISRHFNSGMVRRLEQLAAEHAATLLQAPKLEAVEGFAIPISEAVGAAIIGLDEAAVAEMRASPPGSPLSVLTQRLDAMSPRAHLYPLLLSDADGAISEREVCSLIRLLWLASVTTTSRVIVHSILRLMEHQDLQHAVRQDRQLLASFIEEVMRLHPPEHVLPRIARAEVQLGGRSIPAGAPVFLAVGAANRDPACYDTPDLFRIDRNHTRHLAFGGGIHHCVGAPLARHVVAAVIATLLDRASQLRPLRPLDQVPMFATLTALAPTRLEIGL